MMGRPKKNQDEPEARQRLIDAFWDLLEDTGVDGLTVSAVSARANCNRGTFYYHFEDMDSLITAALEEGLFSVGGIPNGIFNLVTGLDDGSLLWSMDNPSMHRFSLMVKNSEGADLVETKLKSLLLEMWKTVLCPEGSELRPETRAIVEYASGGVLGILIHKVKADASGEEFVIPEGFPHDTAAYLLSQICRAQGISEDEILVRLKMFNQIMRFTGY